NLSFFKLRNDVDPVSIETKFDSFLNENYNRAAPDRVSDRRGAGHARSDGNMWSFGLQNISEVHFSPDIRGLYDMNDIENIWLLGGIALLILFIALINYLNLFIGSSSVRAVEIGLRKVMGADKKRMVYQFNVESIMITVFAFIMGLIIVLFALPVFNQLLDKELDIRNLLIFSNVVYAFLFIMIVAFISGSFSAFIIPKFKPVDILKGKLKLGNRNIFTKTLVIAQFGLSIILLISTLVMGNQIRFLRNRDMGFDKGGLLLIRTFENDAAESKTIAALAQDRMSNNSGIKSVTASLSSFNRYRTSTAPHYVNGRRVNINFNNVYYDYLSTMGVNLIEGRDFSREFSNDTTAIIVNEKFVELLDIDDPIGKSIRINMTGNPELRIIGILEDYHFASLEEEIYPSMLCLNRKTATFNNLLLRISTENITNTIDYLENTWKEIQPDKPFEYSFVDDDIEASFYNLKKWNKIVNITSVLALIVTCIGIFCLTSFIMTRKIKEIGIRKVLGSSVPQILSLIGREFIPFVLIANLIAMPVAWMMMEEWLKDFPYRISIGIDIFIISAVLSITCTVLTVSYHSIRSALTNPVDSLRYE
ncbi:MAG: FtsX-like permease family protein, partial [bacterium]|nr:FtsX-like permease family protein [bacterium]